MIASIEADIDRRELGSIHWLNSLALLFDLSTNWACDPTFQEAGVRTWPDVAVELA
jgi:hypothetical protein